MKKLAATVFCAAMTIPAFGQTPAPSIRIVLPERTRLLQNQMVDLVIEVRNATAVSGLTVNGSGLDLSSRFGAAKATLLDCDTSSDWVYRANLQSFTSNVTLTATVTADGKTLTDSRTIQVRPFAFPQRRNIILFIGDAMGTAYRDSIRLVDRATVDANGKSAFREGFFDTLSEMDRMPVSGMSMTYGTDSIVPDSANTGTAWASGNKSFSGALNVFEDGNDCSWRFTGVNNLTTLPAMLDNPRVENLWQYLKRNFNYRTGIVSTAAITDATPAAQGGYTGYRQARLEIARQYRESPMLGGAPAFDVILGGGADPFTSAGRRDGRDLVGEFQGLGYRSVKNAKELASITGPAPLIGLFKGSAAPAPSSNGIATGDVNMDVAYDKLGLTRPASEPTPSFGTYTDQPMLDLMTRKAIEVLSSTNENFILMVEAASIDKQSHPNNAAGTIWDAIELDRSVGVARTFAAGRERKDTLVVVTADHDQSMIINGVSNTPDAEYFDRSKKSDVSFTTPAGAQAFSVYGDSYANVRSAYPYVNSGGAPASVSTGPAGPPGSFAPTAPQLTPEAGTLSTYAGLSAYKKGSNGYPVNSGTGLRRLAVGFRTGDHTGSSVPITAEGPGALLFTGYMDQTDIFFKMAASASMDTSAIDAALDVLTKSGGFPTTIGK
ncbi:MAG: alkaline phosphatase [Bryobacteraceae bacterium]